MKNKNKTKVLVLLSGGLDSLLACKILQEQVEIEAVHIKIPFSKDSEKAIKEFCDKNKIKFNLINCTKGKPLQDYLQVIRKPKFSRGSGINPCIDCHIFMLKQAKKLADKLKIKVIATGEVLEERPLSQNMKALRTVQEECGFEILRPLSAKLLPESLAEKSHLIDREKLFAIRGRQRKIQLELAKKYNIKFPSPAGGCLLCEREFANKLRDLFQHNKEISERDIELLKIGRHFRIGNTKIIVGRNKEENEKLMKLAKNKIVMEAENIPSPITLVTEKADKETMQKAAEITARYADCENECIIKYKNKKIKARKATQEEIEEYRIK